MVRDRKVVRHPGTETRVWGTPLNRGLGRAVTTGVVMEWFLRGHRV